MLEPPPAAPPVAPPLRGQHRTVRYEVPLRGALARPARRLVLQGVLSTAVIAVVVAATQFLSGTPVAPPTLQYGGSIAAAAQPTYTRSGAANIKDELNRTVAKGFGTATKGGVYDSSISSLLSVSGGAGRIAPLDPGMTVTSTLRGVSTRNEQFQATFSLRDLPAVGKGVTLGLELRRQTAGDAYRAVVHVAPSGAADLSIRRLNGDDTTTLGGATVPFTVTAGTPFVIEGYVADGNGSDVLVRARTWPVDKAIPAWQLALTDASTQSLDTAGRYGVYLTAATNTGGVQTNLWSLAGWGLDVKTPGSPGPSSTAPTSPTHSSSAAPSNSASRTGAAPSSSSPRPSSSAPGSGSSSGGSSSPAAPSQGSVPTAANTGVPAGTNLTVHHGTIDIRTPGTVIDGLDVHGFILVEASHVRIKNSIIRGGVVKHAIGLVDAVYPNVTDLVVQDSTLIASNPAPGLDGVKGKNFRAIRLNISRTIDGAKILGDNVTVKDSYIHGLSTFAHDPYQNGTPSHSDGVQIESGHNITISDNMIVGGYNSGMQITQSVGTVRNLTISGNVLGGGACTLNISQMPTSGLNVTVVSNRFTKTSQYSCPVIIDSGVIRTMRANFYTANAMPFAAITAEPVPIVTRR